MPPAVPGAKTSSRSARGTGALARCRRRRRPLPRPVFGVPSLRCAAAAPSRPSPPRSVSAASVGGPKPSPSSKLSDDELSRSTMRAGRRGGRCDGAATSTASNGFTTWRGGNGAAAAAAVGVAARRSKSKSGRAAAGDSPRRGTATDVLDRPVRWDPVTLLPVVVVVVVVALRELPRPRSRRACFAAFACIFFDDCCAQRSHAAPPWMTMSASALTLAAIMSTKMPTPLTSSIVLFLAVASALLRSAMDAAKRMIAAPNWPTTRSTENAMSNGTRYGRSASVAPT
mmetsp:Transcript_45814/g.141155  ORF Transcript_45814/g.141155 Transcript_45814/m.141155 type:complete len:285 (+) Transcript_45814:93-947(+)